MDDMAGQIASDLPTIVRGDVWADILHRVAYSTDASIYRIIPQCVVAPLDPQDVAALVRYARDRRIPVAARGAATGLAGESLCTGTVFDMTRHMNKIADTEGDGSAVTCEPGVVLGDLHDYLGRIGRYVGRVHGADA